MRKTKHLLLALLLGLSFFQSGFAQCPTFGNFPPPYNSPSSITQNYLLGTKHTLSTTFSLTGLGFSGNNTGAGIQMAIYTDAGNVAGNLVAYTASSTVGSGNTVLSVTTPTLLPPGDYWIMAIYSQSGNHVFYSTAVPNTVCYIALAYGAAIPSTASWLTYSGQDFNYWAVSGGLTVNAPAAICQGAAATLSASGANSYIWNTGATTPSISVSPPVTTDYTVTGNGGCAGISVITVSVNPTPLLQITGASTVCLGSAITQTVITAAPSYTWSGGSNANVVSYTPVNTATITVSSMGVNNCIGTASNVITVLSLPVVTAGNGTICAGTNFTVTPNEAIPYTVSGGQAIVNPTTTTTYTITGIDPNTSCASMVASTVFVNPLPTINVNSSAPVICPGSTATLTASGGIAYSWNTGATTSVVAGTLTSSTAYTVSGTDVNGCIAKSVFTQSVSVCTGIEALSESNHSMNIYPNPANGSVNVEYEGGGILLIYNSLGQLMLSQKNSTFKNEIDISSFKPGVYYFRITTGIENFTQKIIKE